MPSWIRFLCSEHLCSTSHDVGKRDKGTRGHWQCSGDIQLFCQCPSLSLIVGGRYRFGQHAEAAHSTIQHVLEPPLDIERMMVGDPSQPTI